MLDKSSLTRGCQRTKPFYHKVGVYYSHAQSQAKYHARLGDYWCRSGDKTAILYNAFVDLG